jgi:UDPglucose 6-dehydrogenase
MMPVTVPAASTSADSTSAASTPARLHVCVVGAGYVGLTAAACLARLGHRVRCVEVDAGRLAMIERGEMPIHEPGLADLVGEGRASGDLAFSAEIGPALEDAEVALLCVGTPPRASGEPDLGHLAAAARQLARSATRDLVVVVKSTVPPGSCEALELVCAEESSPGVRITVASSPEFLRESRAIEDFLAPDRVVVGAESDDVADVVVRLYPAGAPVVRCDRRGAELVKYASNTFLAVKISFANEVARLCEALGTDAGTVLAGVGADHRIGATFLRPGPGYGGSCLPKDVAGFIALGQSFGAPTALATAAVEQNAGARGAVVDKLGIALGSLVGRKIAVLGLAFKCGTDDTRDSPGLHIVDQLDAAGATVRAYDPLVRDDPGGGRRMATVHDAVAGADAVVVTTGAPEFGAMDPVALAEAMEGDVVFDAAGVCDLTAFAAAGLVVYGIGRGAPVAFHPVVWTPLQWTEGTRIAASL